MLDDIASEDLVAWLEWLAAMGVDAAVEEVATDWLASGPRLPGAGYEWPLAAPASLAANAAAGGGSPPTPSLHRGGSAGETPAPQRPQPAARPSAGRPVGTPAPVGQPAARVFPTTTPDAAESSARTAARSVKSLDELRGALSAFDGCALKATAKNLCFYRGAPRARLMIIGEAPGREEDIEGMPFVGPAGRLLDRMLAAIGISGADAHITNIVYWRPPGNRTPTPQEALVCRPFLERQADLVQPDAILLLGGAAAKAILGVEDGIMRLRGKWRDVTLGERTLPAMATLHPAYLLRTPTAKRLAWRDLLALKARLQQSTAS